MAITMIRYVKLRISIETELQTDNAAAAMGTTGSQRRFLRKKLAAIVMFAANTIISNGKSHLTGIPSFTAATRWNVFSTMFTKTRSHRDR
jgi:hypothetical protein